MSTYPKQAAKSNKPPVEPTPVEPTVETPVEVVAVEETVAPVEVAAVVEVTPVVEEAVASASVVEEIVEAPVEVPAVVEVQPAPVAVEGRFSIDMHCINCDLCGRVAPDNFARHHELFRYIVSKQPADAAELARCSTAMAQCPTKAIYAN